MSDSDSDADFASLPPHHQALLLTPREMALADQAAMAGGVAGHRLMAAAGKAVADAICARWAPRRVTVLCGPGNNGGDGFVIARRLHEAGWRVRLGLLGERAALPPDAALHAREWPGAIEPLAPACVDDAQLVVDAIFGAGLSRPLDGAAKATLQAAERLGVPLCAVDTPSGLDGASGNLSGYTPHAALTVTFFRFKPGHLLLPGREHCGERVVADIGIPAEALAVVSRQTPLQCWENGPQVWGEAFPWPRAQGHKYQRGHVLVAGGALMTGAARLAARAAQRVGAGLVTVAAPAAAWQVYASALESIIVARLENEADYAGLAADPRKNALLVGPGAGADESTRRHVLAALAAGRATVLDADALTVFARDPRALFDAVQGPTVLTPHDGEFARLFAAAGDKLSRARQAARESGCVVVLKGGDTVVAAPDGRALVNAHAPATLATGGTGDVLAGMIAGLLAQGMPAFEAAGAAVWLHGEAAHAFGPGLVADDLPARLPQALAALRRWQPRRMYTMP